MISRICLVLVLVVATNAGESKYRFARQTTIGPEKRWTMYNTPTPSEPSTIPTLVIDPSNEIDPGFSRDPLPIVPLNETTDSDPETSSPIIHINPKWDFSCPRRFGYYRYQQSCDFYVECRNYRPIRKLCPDGMHFKESARWSEYPCGYPSEAPCLSRGGAQPAKPSDQCPHQFGFYPITDKSWPIYERCNRYIVCSAGVATMMNCSVGLAFNPAIEKCDWPERVPGCKDFLGFRCPVPGFGEEDLLLNYRYATDPSCRYFFSCQNGRSRVLSCDEGLAFDAASGKCIDEELVQCNPEAWVPDSINTPALVDKDTGFTFRYDTVQLL